MKRKLIKFKWPEYFNFSMRERRGSLFLALILSIQLLVLYIVKNKSNDFPPPDKKIVSELLRIIKENVNEKEESLIRLPEKTVIPVDYFPFDPNALKENTGLKLGLTPKQIHVILNYLSHGGKFRIKNDFKKMYCISENQFQSLEPFLLLPDSISKVERQKKIKDLSVIKIDINEADSLAFEKLRGIGFILASRIIKYRDKLGGFYATEQIKEVWGVTDSLYQSLLPYFKMENYIPYRQIHLNADSFSILASHPYLKGKIAGLICNFRKQHGSFSTIDELKQLPLISDENFRKLAPYLSPE